MWGVREAEESRIMPMEVFWKTQVQEWGCHLLRWKKILDEKGSGEIKITVWTMLV